MLEQEPEEEQLEEEVQDELAEEDADEDVFDIPEGADIDELVQHEHRVCTVAASRLKKVVQALGYHRNSDGSRAPKPGGQGARPAQKR